MEKERTKDYLPLSEYYLYCNDCEIYFDRWKYCSLEDAGHKTCDVRTLGSGEFLGVMYEEKRLGCLEEEFVSGVIQQRQQSLKELSRVLCRKRGYRIRGE